MAKKMVHLIFPQSLIKKPIIYTLAKRYNLIPNIRRAKVTETVGEMTLELTGTNENLEKARGYLERMGVKFRSVVGDIIE